MIALLTMAFGAPSLDTPHRTEARSNDVAVVVSLEDYAFVPDVSHARHDGVVAGDLFVYTLGVAPERLFGLQAGGREQIEAAVKQAGQLGGPGQRVWVAAGEAHEAVGGLALGGGEGAVAPDHGDAIEGLGLGSTCVGRGHGARPVSTAT